MDWYSLDYHKKLINKNSKYEIILIEIDADKEMDSMNIAKLLIKNGFNGNIFFLVDDTKEVYKQRYGSLLIKENVLNNPEIVFNIEVDILDQICDTTFIAEKVTKGGL